MPKKGYKQTEEHRLKIGLSGRGKKRPPRTAEHKRKLGLSHKGIKLSEAVKKKISESNKGEKHWNYGKHWSAEVKEKNRQTQIGKPKWTEEDKKVMSERRRGNHYALGKHWKLSEETKRKMSEAVKGEKSYLWKGGISPENRRIRLGIEFRLWRESVFVRDNWTCQKYKIKGVKGFGKRVVLHPHHIKNFAEFPELRFMIGNGITLSEKAHKEFHKKYGKKNNTKEQIIEFLSL